MAHSEQEAASELAEAGFASPAEVDKAEVTFLPTNTTQTHN